MTSQDVLDRINCDLIGFTSENEGKLSSNESHLTTFATYRAGSLITYGLIRVAEAIESLAAARRSSDPAPQTAPEPYSAAVELLQKALYE